MKQSDDYTFILGAGALGAMYAQQIAQAGLPVAFLASGERADRLERGGVTVNDEVLRIPVADWSQDTGVTPRRIVVALKDQHLAEALPRLSGACGPETTLISVMNGIDSERQLAEALGEAFVPADEGRVLHCMAKGMDAVRDGAMIRYTRLGVLAFGRRRNDPEQPDPRVAQMQSFFDTAGIAWETPEDMERALWNKFMLNVGINQWSAVLGATYGVFHTQREAQDLMRRAMREVLQIAATRSIDLTEADIEGWFPIVNTLSADGKTSMLQDIEAGRKTEVEMFAGRVVEMGRDAGVPTPVNEILLDAIQTLEGMPR